MQIELPAVPLQEIIDPLLIRKKLKLVVLRTDLNHPQISGNKLYKLFYNIEAANRMKKDTLLTFGGTFSNHIAATAAAGKEFQLKTIGIIRGEIHEPLNPTLQLACSQGMQLYAVTRELFRDKNKLMEYVQNKFSGTNLFVIPEGGSNEEGIMGCKKIGSHIPIDFDTVCCPCGTGATLTGIILSIDKHQEAIGFQVLKGEHYISTEVKKWLQQLKHNTSNWKVMDQFHGGGYAKINNQLLSFINEFEQKHGIPLDPVYTGKMMYGLFELIKVDYFLPGKTIVAIHTGGLQGKAVYNWQFTKGC